MPSEKKRVVITGLGMVTSIGMGAERFWANLLLGTSGIGPVTSFDTSAYKVHVGGEITDFSPAEGTPQGLGRAAVFAVTAAGMALADAGVATGSFRSDRAGVCMGTTSGEPNQIERFNDCFLSREKQNLGEGFIDLYPCHQMVGDVAATHGFTGLNPTMIPAACAAGNYAVAHAFDEIRGEAADLMLAGGADAFSRITYTGFARLRAIAPEFCQPFDRGRKGMIPGEGSGFLLLESLQHARRHGRRIYAEIAGYGFSCDAHHMTASHGDGRGAARAMEKALAESGISAEQVGYISAHGTGTRSNDQNETMAVKRVFGESASRVPISSIKSMLGHTMGAASAIEAGVCALAIRDNLIPPTMNFEEADPECDLDVVPNRAREHRVRIAMNNAYAFGGVNASLILKEFKD